MAGRAMGTTMLPMELSAKPTVHMIVEVEHGADPITGVVIVAGQLREFEGWTSFASAVEWACGLGRATVRDGERTQ
jgi:hypothetical protein